jgi:hypothetical protein
MLEFPGAGFEHADCLQMGPCEGTWQWGAAHISTEAYVPEPRTVNVRALDS